MLFVDELCERTELFEKNVTFADERLKKSYGEDKILDDKRFVAKEEAE